MRYLQQVEFLHRAFAVSFFGQGEGKVVVDLKIIATH